MKADIYIRDITQIAKPFTNSNGQQDFKIDLFKAEDLIKYVALLYSKGHKAEITIDNISAESFNKIKDIIHSAALAKLKKHNIEV